MEATTLPLTFFAAEERCWRLVRTPQGHAHHCREPAVWQGQHRDPTGTRWTVWSCQEHLDGLGDVRPWLSPSS